MQCCCIIVQSVTRSSARAGAQICDLDDDDTSSEAAMLASLGVYDAAAGGSSADPEFPGRIECCSSKCALPEELLVGVSILPFCFTELSTHSHPGLKYIDGWASVTVTIASLAVAGEEKADATGKKRAPSTSKPPLAASTGAVVPPSASATTLVPVDERTVVFLLRDPASVHPPHCWHLPLACRLVICLPCCLTPPVATSVQRRLFGQWVTVDSRGRWRGERLAQLHRIKQPRTLFFLLFCDFFALIFVPAFKMNSYCC